MEELQNLFAEAVDLHQRRQFAEAEKLYRQILRIVPDNRHVLANLAIVCRDLGKLKEAEAYCRQTIAAAPDDPEQYLNLGAILEASLDLDGAGEAYQKALDIAPGHPKVLNNLGKLLHQRGKGRQGLALLEQAIRIVPDYPLALNNLGVVYSEQGDLARAGQCLERSVELDPGNVSVLYNLAGVCNAMNNFPKAKAILTRLLAIDPGHQAGRHMQAALSGTNPPSAPREYVEETFDKYAHRFDTHLQQSLGYTAPTALAGMVRDSLPAALPLAAALDLGCGTGLAGATFRGMTRRLVGVDVSAQMLARAAAKNLYDRLEHQEILAFLDGDGERFELFIAADVLVYLGDPKPLFSAIAARASAAAVVACSIERTGHGGGFELLPSGRYAHNPAALVECAASSGFTELAHQPHQIRKENGAWLAGDLYLFMTTGAG